MSDELKTPWMSASYGMAITATGNVIDLGGLTGDQLKEVIHRVNCHDKLVEALEATIGHLSAQSDAGFGNDYEDELIGKARAALEQAKGGKP